MLVQGKRGGSYFGLSDQLRAGFVPVQNFRFEFASGARQALALYAICGMRRVTLLRWGAFMDLYADRQIGLPMLFLAMLGSLAAAGSVIHAMGHPLICKCGYVKLFYGGLDLPRDNPWIFSDRWFAH
jgi:hypothetical protein